MQIFQCAYPESVVMAYLCGTIYSLRCAVVGHEESNQGHGLFMIFSEKAGHTAQYLVCYFADYQCSVVFPVDHFRRKCMLAMKRMLGLHIFKCVISAFGFFCAHCVHLLSAGRPPAPSHHTMTCWRRHGLSADMTATTASRPT